ncbi:MAG: DUF493 family protein [Cyclobacteriaceae bacterium]|nr:DUF493 family protein [Cyclobacteriaceae bacterium]
MDKQWLTNFHEKLDQHYAWPSLYVFKFIVPENKTIEVKSLFPNHIASEKPSKNGNYISVTIEMMMPSSAAVIEIYQSAAKIEGIIAL